MGEIYHLAIRLDDARGPIWVLGGPLSARLADGQWEVSCEGWIGRGDTLDDAVADWLARRVGTAEPIRAEG